MCKQYLLSLAIIINFMVMEQWKPIMSFAKQYEISNLGNVRSIDRYVKHYRGGLRLYKGQKKNIRYNDNGYLRCNLKADGKRYDFTVHRLVAEAFIPNPNKYPHVNHKNGIKDDNRVENLEWCTAEQNIYHAVKNKYVKTKLTDGQAKEIYSLNLPLRKIAQFYDVNASIVWRIKNKRAYKHIFEKETA